MHSQYNIPARWEKGTCFCKEEVYNQLKDGGRGHAMEERGVETGKGKPEEYNLTMKNLRMQRWILNRQDVMMLYGKQPVIQRIRILWNREDFTEDEDYGEYRKG